MASKRQAVDLRREVVAECSAFLLPIIFVVASVMSIADFFVEANNFIRNFDQYLYMLLSAIGLFEYLIFKKLRMLKFIAVIYLGGTQVYRLISMGEISSISFAWIPPTLLLVSFIYSVRMAVFFVFLYTGLPILVVLGNAGEKLPDIFMLGGFSGEKIYISLLGAIALSLCFTYVFEVYRKKIQLALKESSHLETEERFFATLGHEVNNPISIAILALNRNYVEGSEPKRDLILKNLIQLAGRSKEFESSLEKFRL